MEINDKLIRSIPYGVVMVEFKESQRSSFNAAFGQYVYSYGDEERVSFCSLVSIQTLGAFAEVVAMLNPAEIKSIQFEVKGPGAEGRMEELFKQINYGKDQEL
jgi:hypothetical protein